MQEPGFFNRKKTDDYFLEVIAMIIFVSGFRYDIVVKRWPDIFKAFDCFSVEKVSLYDERKIAKLLTNEKIIRNRKKIAAIINNACKLREIKKEHGSVKKWIDWVFKRFRENPVENDHPIDYGSRSFERIGEKTIKWFYWSAGKKVD